MKELAAERKAALLTRKTGLTHFVEEIPRPSHIGGFNYRVVPGEVGGFDYGVIPGEGQERTDEIDAADARALDGITAGVADRAG